MNYWIASGVLLCSVSTIVDALPIVESRVHDSMVLTEVVGNETDQVNHLALKQIESLRKELSELRGVVETQDHEINRLRKSQQKFYIDLDKRVDLLSENTKKVSEKMEPTVMPEKTVEQLVELNEKEAFDVAYRRVRAKDYVKAIVAFQDYLERFPQGEHLPQAHYWIGEIYMARWEQEKSLSFLDRASESFLTVTSMFPTHAKATDALLKLGLIEKNKGNLVAAKRYLLEVKDRYPGSAAARIAKAQLPDFN